MAAEYSDNDKKASGDRGAYRLSDRGDYHAEDAYQDGQTRRQSVIDMGRRMAALTIPSVFPPEGYHTGDYLPGNNQALAALLVNNLSSALMFMAFPPNQPILRFEPIEYKMQADIDADPEMWAMAQLSLGRLELSHRHRLQATTIMSTYVQYLKVLLIAGNCLWKHTDLNNPTFHLPDTYVVKRSSMGVPLYCVHEECISLETMDDDHRDQVMEVMDEDEYKDKKPWDVEVKIYSCLKLKPPAKRGDQGSWLYWQETHGVMLNETEVEADFDAPPMWPGGLIPVYNQDWFRGYCEEYMGDLYAIEQMASSLNDAAAAAALNLLFVKPGSTSKKQVEEARNLQVLAGNAEDVTMFRTEKAGDYSFVASREETIAKRLGQAFLMTSSIQRAGERVTAEEWKQMGQEIDKAMGGLYTALAQGNQRLIIIRAVKLHEEEAGNTLPKVPTNLVNIEVITGIDALGQTTEAQQLQDFAAAGVQAFPKQWEMQADANNYLIRMATALGLKPDGLLKKPDQVAQEQQQGQQQAMQQEMVSKGVGPAINALSASAQQGGGMANMDPQAIQQAMAQMQQGGGGQPPTDQQPGAQQNG